MKEGATDYVTKPVRMADLLAALNRGMDLRRARAEAEKARRDLEIANQDLNDFARRVAHDLKAPLAPISLLAGSLKLASVDPRYCVRRTGSWPTSSGPER